MNLISLAENSWVPDALIRVGIRRLLRQRLADLSFPDAADHRERLTRFTKELRTSPLAIATELANEQHYEVSPDFFSAVLGPRLKYSACYFANGRTSLAQAEDDMLRLTCQRAEIKDGMRVLELGCGWGSLTLWMAERFPDCEITALSNSASQCAHIAGRSAERGISNIRVMTADMRAFSTSQQFDRVISVEMFEHLRNFELLLHRVSSWLTPEGKAFVHIFCHRETPYFFDSDGAANWMGRHFFTGGMMPSEDLFRDFDDDLGIARRWRVNGLHYWRTSEAWLHRLDHNREEILARFRQDLPAREADISLQRWRIFFMACAELFRFRGGTEWFVSHYLFTNKARHVSAAHHPQLQQVG